jgi:hypothetical protein
MVRNEKYQQEAAEVTEEVEIIPEFWDEGVGIAHARFGNSLRSLCVD